MASNILFQVADQARRWLDSEISPSRRQKRLLGPLTLPFILSSSFLEENVIVVDFGLQSSHNYFSPESRFDDVVTAASDIWELACAIFEIRAGRPLFSTFMLSQSIILCETVLTLGNTFEGRDEWIGAEDAPPMGDGGPVIEPVGMRLKEEEIVLLSDLSEKMLKYRPEERIAIQEVVQHPWFEYASA
ncbi:kinase-like protein [Amanita rubescens]|nr:kinase-like protein [Amanita rubescens]